MNYYLFLDDERNPKDVKWIELPLTNWTIVRSHKEFTNAVLTHGVPKFVTFDHDLAEQHYDEFHWCHDRMNPEAPMEFRYETMREKTGLHCAKWLCKYCLDHHIKFPEYTVHSFNPIGKENIVAYIENYKRVMENEN